MRRSVSMTLAAALLASPLVLTTPSPVIAGDKTDAPTPVTLTRWTSDADFQRGEREGLAVQGGSLALDGTASLPSTTYTDPFGAGTARSYDVGTWTSSVVEVDYPIDQAISSWNAITPTGTWVETSFRGRYLDGTWSKWYVLGRWTSGMRVPRRHPPHVPQRTGRHRRHRPHRHLRQPQEAQARRVPDPCGPVASDRRYGDPAA